MNAAQHSCDPPCGMTGTCLAGTARNRLFLDFPAHPRQIRETARSLAYGRTTANGIPSQLTAPPGVTHEASSVTFPVIRWPRVLTWGLSVVVLMNVWIAYCEYVVRASRLNGSHFPVALVAAMAALVLAVWPLLKAIGGSSWGISTPERHLILAMGFVGAAIPANGLTGFMMGIIATPYYYATPENNWASFHPFIPGWIVPPDAHHAMRWFFNGLPPGEPIPWHVWWIPLIWWFSLAAAIMGICLALSIILRKQWVEYERLSYPLVEASKCLLAENDDSRGRRPVWQSRLFWVGTTIGAFILVYNTFAWFDPRWPMIDIAGRGIVLFRGVPDLKTRINFLTLGLSYFAPQQVLGSLIVGCLVTTAEAGAFARVGFSLDPAGDSWTNDNVAIGWQSFGAMIVFVLWGLWQARRHLAAVWRSAWAGTDDGTEMLSYRVALVVLTLSLLYVTMWLHRAGMDVSFAVTFVFFTVIGYLALGRMVAEAGYVYQRVPISPQSATAYTLGVESFHPATMAGFAFSYALIANGRGLFMPAVVQATRLADSSGKTVRKALGAIALAFVVGFAVSVAYTLYLGYTYGAFNFRVYPFSGGNYEAFAHTIRKIKNPFGPDVTRLSMAGAGSAVMAGLIFLRYRFPGFAFHPIGMVFPFTYLTRFAVFSMSIAWLVKFILLRLGGVELYRKTRPLFLGLAAGYALGVAYSFVVDWIYFPGAGHGIHSW